uniref:GATA-type domain-containing protein n=1 Tax=Mycena chlorophos TaxID=658473 RepID=A0ABQ0LCN2_MYCCL|nr:predicted protein [Mycena chlorophos]
MVRKYNYECFYISPLLIRGHCRSAASPNDARTVATRIPGPQDGVLRDRALNWTPEAMGSDILEASPPQSPSSSESQPSQPEAADSPSLGSATHPQRARRRHYRKAPVDHRPCPNCHTPNPKEWRWGTCSGVHVCNSCSKYEAVHKRPRPSALEAQRVKRRRAGGLR